MTKAITSGCYHSPMKGSGKHQIVICSELIQTISEGAVVDETPGLVNDNQSQDTPFNTSRISWCSLMLSHVGRRGVAYMMKALGTKANTGRGRIQLSSSHPVCTSHDQCPFWQTRL